jgi:hypothetical protein
LRSAIPVGFIGPSATTGVVQRGEKVYKTFVIEETSEMLGRLVSESSAERWCFEHEQVRSEFICPMKHVCEGIVPRTSSYISMLSCPHDCCEASKSQGKLRLHCVLVALLRFARTLTRITRHAFICTIHGLLLPTRPKIGYNERCNTVFKQHTLAAYIILRKS